MTRFDDLFDTGQPADGLEDELRRMLAAREVDITEPARPSLDGERLQLPPHRSHRISDLPGGRTGTLLAAAVVALLVLGSAFLVRGLSHQRGPAGLPTAPTLSRPAASSPVPSPSSTAKSKSKSCPLPASWTAAIAAGAIAVDQPLNQPVSAGPDGSFLMWQGALGQAAGQADYTHQELSIFDRAGHGSTIWQAADPVHDSVDYSPDSAISTGWVVFGLTRSQNLAAHGVAAWNRATGQLSTPRLLSTAEQAANLVIDFDPIVVNDTAYWVEQKFNDPAHQTLVSQQLPAGQHRNQPVSHVSRLVAVGTGVALLHDANPGPPGSTGGLVETLTAGPGLAVPGPVLASATGTAFASDGATLRWLATRNGTVQLLSWRSGQPLGVDTVPNAPAGAEQVGPFLAPLGAATVLDTRTGATLRLPPGTAFVLATGGDLILSTSSTKFGAAAVHRVALSALAPARC